MHLIALLMHKHQASSVWKQNKDGRHGENQEGVPSSNVERGSSVTGTDILSHIPDERCWGPADGKTEDTQTNAVRRTKGVEFAEHKKAGCGPAEQTF